MTSGRLTPGLDRPDHPGHDPVQREGRAVVSRESAVVLFVVYLASLVRSSGIKNR